MMFGPAAWRRYRAARQKAACERLVRELWPFLWAQLVVLALLSLFPALSSALPNLLGYR